MVDVAYIFGCFSVIQSDIGLWVLMCDFGLCVCVDSKWNTTIRIQFAPGTKSGQCEHELRLKSDWPEKLTSLKQKQWIQKTIKIAPEFDSAAFINLLFFIRQLQILPGACYDDDRFKIWHETLHGKEIKFTRKANFRSLDLFDFLEQKTVNRVGFSYESKHCLVTCDKAC